MSKSELIAERYEIVNLLGQGGMGKVYRAVDLELKRDVAIKVIALDTYSNQLFARFQQEARAVSKLNHPGIITAHDFGLTENNNPFLVMEFIQGRTLDAILEKDGALEVDEFLSIFIQITSAMNHAHSKGVVHRDLKPSNIIIDSRDKMRALVLDFGIAKSLDDRDSMAKTKTGNVIGSPKCVSPEQIHGKTLDGRSDIYSLGCVMFESITGEPLFSGETALETMQMHLKEEPDLITKRKSLPDVPEKLEAIISKCLKKDPEERYQSMDELKQELESIGAEFIEIEEAEEVSNVESTSIEPAKEDSGKSKATVLILILVVAISIAGLTFVLSRIQNKELISLSRPITTPDVKTHTEQSFVFNGGEPEKLLAEAMGRGEQINCAIIGQAIEEQYLKKLMLMQPKYLGIVNSNMNESRLEIISTQKTIKDIRVFNNEKVTPAGIKHLGNLSLTGLGLSNCELTDQCLDVIATFNGLVNLDIERNSSVTIYGLKKLSSLKKLKNVNLYGCKINDEQLNNFKNLLPGVKVTNTPTTSARRLATRIKNLAGWGIVPEDLSISYEDNEKTSLKSAPKVSNSKKGNMFMRYTKLASPVDASKITDDSLVELIVSDLNQPVKALVLNKVTRLTPTGFKKLAQLERLHYLDLTASSADDTALKYISKTPLHNLVLTSCKKITDSGLKYLEKPRSLHTLELEDTQITDKSMEYLGRIQKLKRLNLSRCLNLTDKGVKSLRRLNKLILLDLSGNKSLNQVLPELQNFPSLTMLAISGWQLSDKDIDVLSQNKKLVFLAIGNTNIDDNQLSKLTQNNSLRYLLIENCKNLAPDTVAKYKRTKPSLTIVDKFKHDTPDYMNQVYNDEVNKL